MFNFWKKKPAQAAPAVVSTGWVDDPPAQAGPAYNLDVSMLTDVGCVRPVNQDYGAIVRPSPPSPKGVLITVADGMGGHKGGEVASRRAVEVVSRFYYEVDGDPQSTLTNAFLTANREIYQQSLDTEECHGMGTTCTAIAVRDGLAYSAHIGDSRMYLIRGGDIYLMTEDHSAVMQLVKQGALTLAEARHHADKNVITRAMGSKPEVEVSTWAEPFPVRAGDRFVLCSDGLYDRIEDLEIRDVVSKSTTQGACEALVGMAKERGGYDNITIAVVSLQPVLPPDERPARETREVEVPI